MSAIADLFAKLLLDDTGFESATVKSAAAAGEKGGVAMSKSLGAALRANAGKIIAGGLAAGIGLATKGLLQLEEIQAEFQAQTGATAEEAEKAGKAINAMAGSNIQSMQEVGDALITVTKEMGLTGDKAVAVTQQFLTFARATGQEASVAIRQFDSLLDAWNLTADDAQAIMDKMIVSTQKFGGSVPHMTDALIALAPALQAANIPMDSAIGLLNAFEKAGVDGTVAVRGMQTALARVKSPQELQRLIDDIEHTVDPFQRAQKAIALFGNRAGAKLAQALAPGEQSLKDYMVTTDESVGATERAREALDNTWGAKFQLLMKGAGAALIGFGTNFGSALTGIATAALAFSTLGGGRLVKGLLGPLVGLGKRITARIVAAIMEAIIPTFIAGEAVGEAEAAGVAAGMQSSKAMSAANAVLTPLGKVWGSILGKAFVLGALAVIGVELWQQLQDIQAKNAQQQREIGQSIGNEVAAGTVEGLQQSRAALEKGISDLDLMAMLFGGDARNAQTELRRQLAIVDDAIVGIMQDADKAAALAERGGQNAGIAFADGYIGGINHKEDEITQQQENAISNAAAFAWKTAVKEGRAAGGDVIAAYAQGILDQQSAVSRAFAAAVNQGKQSLTAAEEEVQIIGQLTSKALADGLKDGRADVRLAWEEVQRIGLERLQAIVADGRPLGKKAMDELNAALHSKNPAIRKTAQQISASINSAIEAGKKAAGHGAGDKINQGLKDKKNPIHKTAYQIGVDIVNAMYAGIAAGRGGGFGGSGGGYNPFAKAAGGPVFAGVPYVVGEKRPELFVPNVNGSIVPSVPSGQGHTFNITVNAGADVSPLAARRFGQSVLDAVADGLREQTARTA